MPYTLIIIIIMIIIIIIIIIIITIIITIITIIAIPFHVFGCYNRQDYFQILRVLIVLLFFFTKNF